MIPDGVIDSVLRPTAKLVNPEPLPVITPPVTLIPALAVMIPIESILVTSSYVSTPPTPRLPVTVAFPETFKVPVVTIPDNTAFVDELILSVEATPTNQAPLPENDVAVQTPVTIKPLVAVGALLPALFFILSARIIDIVLLTLFYIYTTPNW